MEGKANWIKNFTANEKTVIYYASKGEVEDEDGKKNTVPFLG